MKKLIQKASAVWCVRSSQLNRKLCETAGSVSVEMVVLIIVVLVVIVGLVLPQIWDLLTDSFTGADSKVDEIWNYKG